MRVTERGDQMPCNRAHRRRVTRLYGLPGFGSNPTLVRDAERANVRRLHQRATIQDASVQ